MYDLIIEYGIVALGLILSGLGWLAIRFLLVLIDQMQIREYAGRLLAETFAAVREVGQTYVAALREANLDGKITAFEAAEAKKRAIAIAKSNLGKKGVMRLAKVFDVDDWVGTQIEAIVGEDNRLGKPAPTSSPE